MPGHGAPLRDFDAVEVGLAEGEQDADGDAKSTHQRHEQLRGPKLL